MKILSNAENYRTAKPGINADALLSNIRLDVPKCGIRQGQMFPFGAWRIAEFGESRNFIDVLVLIVIGTIVAPV